MLNYFKKITRLRKMKKDCGKESPEVRQEKDTEFSEELGNNINLLKGIIVESSDLIIRTFTFGKQIKAAIIYIDGLTDKALISETILKPLMYRTDGIPLPDTIDMEYVRSELLFTGSLDIKKSLNDVVRNILSGDTAFLMDGAADALVISLRGWQSRGIQEPQTESVVRGPREGFSETLRINTSLLRRKIKNPNLKFETITIGDRTGTDVCIAYINGLAKPELIEEIKRRLKKIHIDGVLESGYIEQYIEDAPYSIFSTISNSEKPDKVAAKMLEGRAAILVDGTPFVLTVPMVFIESFQSEEDYYSRPFFVSMIRILRFIAFFSAYSPLLYMLRCRLFIKN